MTSQELITQGSLDSVQEFYIAYIRAPADPGALDFWATKLDLSNDLSDILWEFGGSHTYTDEYGDLENDVLINRLYQQLFNREADPEGLAFYTDRLETGEATLASIAKQIIDGAAQGSIDATILDNKVSVAHCVTEDVFTTNSPYDYLAGHWDTLLDSIGQDPVECEDVVVVYEPIFSEPEIQLREISGVSSGGTELFI